LINDLYKAFQLSKPIKKSSLEIYFPHENVVILATCREQILAIKTRSHVDHTVWVCKYGNAVKRIAGQWKLLQAELVLSDERRIAFFHYAACVWQN
jgi:hypothetical protein